MLPRTIIPLAWRNLTENKRRLLASVAGTAFAVTLMFMENGFRHAMLDSMVNVIERLDGQVVHRQPDALHAGGPLFIPLSPDRSRRRNIPEVDRRQPGLRGDPDGLLARSSRRLARPDLRHRHPAGGRRARSRPRCGRIARRSASPTPRWPMSCRAPPVRTSSRRARSPSSPATRSRSSGTFELGINAQSNGNLIMSDRNLLKLLSRATPAPRWARTPSPSACCASGRAPIPIGCEPAFRRRLPRRRPRAHARRVHRQGTRLLGPGGADRHRLLHRRGDGLHRRLRDLLPGALRRHQRPARRVRHAQGHGLLEPPVVPAWS